MNIPIDLPAPSQSKFQFEFQELGVELEPIYGKVVWSLFYWPGFTERKIRRAHQIAQEKGITKVGYLIGIVRKDRSL